MKDQDKGFFDVLSNIIDEAFAKVFTEKTEIHKSESSEYSSIEEYTAKTGKRFRMSKDQKERGLNRDAAFTELHINKEK